MITIGGKEYKLRYTMRGQFVYEHIAGVPFSPDKLLNVYLLIFCFLLVNNEDFRMTFDEFINALDEEPETIGAIMKWMEEETRRMSLMAGGTQDETKDPKKKG